MSASADILPDPLLILCRHPLYLQLVLVTLFLKHISVCSILIADRGKPDQKCSSIARTGQHVIKDKTQLIVISIHQEMKRTRTLNDWIRWKGRIQFAVWFMCLLVRLFLNLKKTLKWYTKWLPWYQYRHSQKTEACETVPWRSNRKTVTFEFIELMCLKNPRKS